MGDRVGSSAVIKPVLASDSEDPSLLDVSEHNEKRFILLAESLSIKSYKVVRKLFKGRNKNIIEIKQSKNCSTDSHCSLHSQVNNDYRVITMRTLYCNQLTL